MSNRGREQEGFDMVVIAFIIPHDYIKEKTHAFFFIIIIFSLKMYYYY
jgi:hypothetical protein